MEWAEVENIYNNIPVEPRGVISGILEAWFWDHPNDQASSDHALPINRNMDQTVELTAFLSGYSFDPSHLEAVFEYEDGEGSIWWLEPYIRDYRIMFRISCTENDTGLAQWTHGKKRFDHDLWMRIYSEWLNSPWN